MQRVIPMSDKTITYWLVFDWKKEDVRARKTKPKRSELGTNELLVEGELVVSKPEIEVPKLAAELNIPASRIRRVVAEGMETDTEFPDWFETVDEVFDNHPDLVDERQVDALVGKVMIEDPGHPDPVDVHDEIQQRIWERNDTHSDQRDHPGGEA